jgi:hypothetical protein
VPRIIAIAGGALIIYQWAVARPLWLDEEMIALNIRERGILALAGPLSLGQSAPYGWLVLQRVVFDLAGGGERALRFVPMLCGLAAIASALWIGRRWLSPIATGALVLTIAAGQWLSYSYVELKHYSADACFALLLPALAVWAIEEDRVARWWVAAAVAQFIGNGALFVTPGCALVIVATVWRRRGVRAAIAAAAPGLLWLALVAVNFLVALGPAQASRYLQTYWQLEFPPRGAGPLAVVRWLAARLVPFAEKPGGTRAGLAFWIAAAAGFALARGRRRLVATAFALVPLSAFAVTTAHVLPFFERLVLWVVPALCVGVTLLADVHPVAIVFALALVADITYVGLGDLRARPAATHHRLDDRGAVRWLAAREQPGDVWVTTHYGLPAMWWYAPAARGPILEVGDAEPGADCTRADLARAVDGATRVLVLLGFRFDDVPTSFDDLLLNRFKELGQMTGYRELGEASRVAIFDRRLASRRDQPQAIAGCIRVQPARRW